MDDNVGAIASISVLMCTLEHDSMSLHGCFNVSGFSPQEERHTLEMSAQTLHVSAHYCGLLHSWACLF